MSIHAISDDGFVKALEGGENIRLSAFTLHEGPVLDALKDAAKNGASVEVNLADDHFVHTIADLKEQNRYAVSTLRRAGASVHLNNERTNPGHPLHAKFAAIDGVGYLDERNWPNDGRDLILRDDGGSDLNIMNRALDGEAAAGSGPNLTALKSDALQQEADVIERSHGKSLDVMTESFGPSAVDDAMLKRAKDGASVRLIAVRGDVYGEGKHKQAKAAIEDLIDAGAEVRVNPTLSNEKMAIASDRSAWVGSTNATRGRPGTIDWGMETHDPQIIHELRDHFEKTWEKAVPYDPVAAKSESAKNRR